MAMAVGPKRAACRASKVTKQVLKLFVNASRVAANWQRPKGEVLSLMRLLDRFLKEKTPELIEKNVRLQAIGRLTDLPESSQEQLHKTIEQTAANTGLTLIFALSYGGRLEIIDGIKSLLRAIELGHIDRAMIDVEMFSKHLYT